MAGGWNQEWSPTQAPQYGVQVSQAVSVLPCQILAPYANSQVGFGPILQMGKQAQR